MKTGSLLALQSQIWKSLNPSFFALRSSASGDQPCVKSFAAAVASSSLVRDSQLPDLGELSSSRGEPAFRISRQDIARLAEPHRNVLIGRFSYSRPSMEVIRKFFVSLGLKGACSVGLFDTNHVIIRPTQEEDYTRLFVRRTWFVQSSPMTISKWTPDFKSSQESSIVPVWVILPNLPLYFYNTKSILKLASLLGRPLKVDSATAQFKRPSLARVLVEGDVSKQPARRIWVGDENSGHWQQVEYEDWPNYCTYCERIGHSDQECFRKNPELKPKPRVEQQGKAAQPAKPPQQVSVPRQDKGKEKVSLISEEERRGHEILQMISKPINENSGEGTSNQHKDSSNSMEVVAINDAHVDLQLQPSLEEIKRHNQQHDAMVVEGNVSRDQSIAIMADSGNKLADNSLEKVFENSEKQQCDGELIEGVFTDPESDSEPVTLSNKFAQLENLSDDVWLHLQKTRSSSAPQSPTPLSPRGMVDRGRRKSVDNTSEEVVSSQQLKDFQAGIGDRLRKLDLFEADCPRSALLDSKDIQLLNKLGKKGRPPNYNKKLVEFKAQVKSSSFLND